MRDQTLPEEVKTLSALRKYRGYTSKVTVARMLGFTPDVWNKFEVGAILPESLSALQVACLAHFFGVSPACFMELLSSCSPTTLYQSRKENASPGSVEAIKRQTFATALARSTMSNEAKVYWLNPSPPSECDGACRSLAPLL